MKTKIKYVFPGIFLLFVLIFDSCEQQSHQAKENKAIAELFIESINKQEIDKLVSLFAEDCLYEEVASGRSYADKKGIAAYITSTLSGIPDSKFEINSIVTNDTMAVIEWTWKGTNTVGWKEMGIPATDKYFEIRGVSVMEIENKHIRRVSDYWDWNTFIKGIGVE
jgi:steroid delta-isomerase-like uncharacterized protein